MARPSQVSSGVPLASSIVSTLDLLNGSLSPGATATYNGLGPGGIAYDPASDRLFVPEGASDSLSIVDAGSGAVVATLPTGVDPVDALYVPATEEVYVADLGNGSLTVVNATTDRYASTIRLDSISISGGPAEPIAPESLAYDNESGWIYIGSENLSAVVGVTPNGAVQAVGRPVAASPASMTFDPVSGNLYVVGDQGDTVAVINGSSFAYVTNLTVGDGPEWSCYDPATNAILVGNSESANISVINGSSDAVSGAFATGFAGPMAVDPTGLELFVAYAHRHSGFLAELSADNGTFLGETSTGAYPAAIVVDPTDGRLLVANEGSDNLTVADLSNLTELTPIPLGTDWLGLVADPAAEDLVGLDAVSSALVRIDPDHRIGGAIPLRGAPRALAYDPENGLVYVAELDGPTIVAVNVTTGSIPAILPEPTLDDPVTLAFDALTDQLLVVDAGLDELVAIDPANGTVVGSVAVGSNPGPLAIDPTTGVVFVGNLDTFEVSVIDGASLATIAEVPTLFSSASLAFDPSDGYVYSLSVGVPAVSVLNGASGAIVANVTTSSDPVALAYDPVFGGILVLDAAAPSAGLLVGTTFERGWTVQLPGTPSGAAIDPSDGNATVLSNGAGAAYLLGARFGYPVRFAETGLPNGTDWSVSVGSWSSSGPNGSFTAVLPNGSYGFTVQAPAAYAATPSGGPLVVNGTPISIPIGFALLPIPSFPVVFSAAGLPNGTPWGITLNGSSQSSAGGELNWTLPNGSYGYFVRAPTGFTAAPPDGVLDVAGVRVTRAIVFSPMIPSATRSTSSLSSTPPAVLWVLAGLALAEAVALAILAILLYRRRDGGGPGGTPGRAPIAPGPRSPYSPR